MAIFNATKPDEALLTAQLHSGHAWLRFRPELEKLFRVDFFRRGLGFRVGLLFLAAVLVAITPLFDSALLHAPAEFNAKARVLQFGMMIPALLLAVLVSSVPALRRLSGFFTMVASLVVGVGLLAQRAIGAQYDFDMPLEFAGITVAATFLLARFRFWFFLPAALALLLATVAVEALIVQPPANGWYRVIATSMLVLISAVAAFSLEYVIRAAWLNEYVLRKWSNQDPLTSLLNRRAFNVTANRSLQQAARDKVGVGVAMIDLDEFKRYNDRYGHQSGDACLQRVADILKINVRRPLDCCGRFGGEEFVALWFDVSQEEVDRIANSLCWQLRDARVEHETSSVAEVVTLSVGVVTCIPDANTRLDVLIEKADRALYQAKLEGRDRWITAIA